KPNQDFMRF
uniref:CalliFMRFamide-4 n=1 Tax=Calliphora vomitoria TaxID=27454 RepID=FAR4_CALVO|nr:RecName: Full=CalliFMRFamide-4 [Calliphora vomitoria]